MKRKKITILSAAIMLLAFLAVPLGMRGQSTYTIGWGTASGEEGTYTNFDATSGSVEGILSFSTEKNSSQTVPAYNSNSSELRLYFHSSGDGGSITITPAEGVTITDAVITTSTSPTVAYYVDGGIAVNVTATNNSYTISGISAASSLKIQNANTTNTQLRIKTIALTYTNAGGDTPTVTYHTLTIGANPTEGGTVTVGNTTIAEGATTSISATANTGYVFNNWTVIGEGSSVNETGDTFTMGTEDATLTAIFTAVTTYTVTYHANVTGIDDIEMVYNEGEDVTVANNAFSNPGHAFVEWNTNENGEGDSYAPGDVISDIESNINLYAQWEESNETVDVLNWEATGSPTNYTDWTYNALSGAAYAGQSSGTYQSIQLRSSNNNSGIITTTSAGNVTKVTVTWNNNTASGRTLNVYGKNSAYSAVTDLYGNNAGTLIGTIVYGTSTELDITDDYEFIGMRSASGAMYLDEIDITWTSGSNPAVATVTVINVPEGFNTDIYQGTEAGTLTATVSAGETTLEATSVTWTSSNEAVATIDENGNVTLVAVGNTTITASYAGEEGVYKPSTATYQLTVVNTDPDVPGTENNPYTVAQARAAIDAGTGTQGVYATGIVSAIVTEYNTQFSNITFNFVDNEGDEDFLQAYRCGGEEAVNVVVGDSVVVYGNLTYYMSQGIYEFAQGCQVVSLTHPVITEPSVTVTPDMLNVPYTSGENQGSFTVTVENIDNPTSPWYIFYDPLTEEIIDTYPEWIVPNCSYSGEVFSLTYNIDENNSAESRTACFKYIVSYQEGETSISVSSNLITVIQEGKPQPSVTVTPSTINAPAEGADGALVLAYENITEFIAFDYYFCDAEGQELQENPDWIGAEIQEDALYYLIGANDSEARSAYIKIYTYDDDEEEVYAIVTVNQAEYVVDYAELPFEFDGGRNDIATTAGLTQENLGTDYNNSPKLKFEKGNKDNDGLYSTLILKFNERPGTLTFDIKGNGFSGGTFTVQTSEDGVTYENLDEYTELGNADTKTFDNLGENVRYIKWIYTEKVNGNVALGNITLAKYEAPQPSVTVTPSIINAPAEGADGSFALAYENITEFIGFDFSFCDANGGELEEDPDWIDAEMHGEDSLYYVIGDNTSEARTAYIKVYTYDDNLEVYAIVTVNQAEYVAPVELEDYAIFTGDLIEGDYLIVYNGNAMNNVVSSDRLQYEEVEAENDVISTDNAAIVWHIAPNDGGYWTIYSANANAYAAGTGVKNKAQMLADGTDDKALWTVTGTETFEFVNKANSEAGVNANLRNNGTYGFACYSTLTGGALTLYKKVTTTADYTLNITGYGDSEKDHYYLFASPVYGLNPANVEGMTDGEFDLYYFDQTQELEWINYETENGINHFYLTPGKGYLYAHKTDTTLTFTGEPYAGNGQIALTYDANAELAGWNLIGNPFSMTADLDMNYYKLNPEGSDVLPEPQSSSIEPMEGVFVYAYNEQMEEPIAAANFSVGAANLEDKGITLNLTHNTTAVVDRAIVTFGEGNQLPKFQLNPNNTKLYVSQNDKEYAIVRSAAQGEMPVSFKAAENGTYTLNVDANNVDVNYLHLVDNMTGADVDLLATPSYTFEAHTTDYATRFSLVFMANGIEEGNTVETFAFFNGSEWVISNVGEATLEVVDLMGRVISSETVNGNANLSLNQVPGVYVLRLVNGNDMKVQKIVVK